MKKILLIIVSIALMIGAAVYILFVLEINGVFSIGDGLSRAFKVKYPLSFYMGENGTADKLEGKTVCVSLFVDLENNKWHDEDTDSEKIEDCYDNLRMATEWITDQVAEYGKSAEFIYDWKKYPELYHEVEPVGKYYAYHLRENDGYNLLWDYVNNNVNSAELLEIFDADNIIYVTYFDVNKGSRTDACAKDCYFDPQYSYEMIYIPQGYNGFEITATAIAHEILHVFGAPDWFQGGSDPLFFGVGDKCINYMFENYPNDIMVRTFDRERNKPFYGEVNGEISEMTAYYVGLIDEAPSAVYDFNLDLSQHDPNRPRFVPDEE